MPRRPAGHHYRTVEAPEEGTAGYGAAAVSTGHLRKRDVQRGRGGYYAFTGWRTLIFWPPKAWLPRRIIRYSDEPKPPTSRIAWVATGQCDKSRAIDN